MKILSLEEGQDGNNDTIRVDHGIILTFSGWKGFSIKQTLTRKNAWPKNCISPTLIHTELIDWLTISTVLVRISIFTDSKKWTALATLKTANSRVLLTCDFWQTLVWKCALSLQKHGKFYCKCFYSILIAARFGTKVCNNTTLNLIAGVHEFKLAKLILNCDSIILILCSVKQVNCQFPHFYSTVGIFTNWRKIYYVVIANILFSR